ncbi:unnamed protein product, partial [Prorocentrum cordatum]
MVFDLSEEFLAQQISGVRVDARTPDLRSGTPAGASRAPPLLAAHWDQCARIGPAFKGGYKRRRARGLRPRWIPSAPTGMPWDQEGPWRIARD